MRKAVALQLAILLCLLVAPSAVRAQSFNGSIAGKVMDTSGYAEELAAGNVSDALIDDLSALGDEAQIKESLGRFRDAGVTLPCVLPIGSHDGAAGYVQTLEAAREA